MFQLALPPDPMFQYFAVSEWVVEGTCMCNGHASMCAPAPGESIAQDKVHNHILLVSSCKRATIRPGFEGFDQTT